MWVEGNSISIKLPTLLQSTQPFFNLAKSPPSVLRYHERSRRHQTFPSIHLFDHQNEQHGLPPPRGLSLLSLYSLWIHPHNTLRSISPCIPRVSTRRAPLRQPAGGEDAAQAQLDDQEDVEGYQATRCGAPQECECRVYGTVWCGGEACGSLEARDVGKGRKRKRKRRITTKSAFYQRPSKVDFEALYPERIFSAEEERTVALDTA
jgi:hypothetical protein